jgi:hypothetical protein
VTLKGKYSDWNAEEILTYGRNKDYRWFSPRFPKLFWAHFI